MRRKVTEGICSIKKRKKIKDKKQIKLAAWGLAAALNPERSRDIVIQRFLSPGRGTGFWEAVSVGVEAWGGGAGDQGGAPYPAWVS